ncbi:uncharacterized protein LOC134656578 [Cydia amplana]|uniref:uncharacterized protein LOC134656578 n=1 Tax=Cydia amplana TaxID=1869771 RepID=UPI002FE53834
MTTRSKSSKRNAEESQQDPEQGDRNVQEVPEAVGGATLQPAEVQAIIKTAATYSPRSLSFKLKKTGAIPKVRKVAVRQPRKKKVPAGGEASFPAHPTGEATDGRDRSNTPSLHSHRSSAKRAEIDQIKALLANRAAEDERLLNRLEQLGRSSSSDSLVDEPRVSEKVNVPLETVNKIDAWLESRKVRQGLPDESPPRRYEHYERDVGPSRSEALKTVGVVRNQPRVQYHRDFDLAPRQGEREDTSAYAREPQPAPPRQQAAYTSTPRVKIEQQERGMNDTAFMSDAAAAFQALADQLKDLKRPKPPKQVYELPYFSGDTSEWQIFFKAYEETTKRYEFSDYENMARLRNSLRGEARACVHHLLATASEPDLIIRILQKNFGRNDLIIDRALEELRRLPNVGTSALDLNNFATKVANIVSTLIHVDKKNYGDNPLLIREVTERLSPHLRSKWCSYAAQNMSKGKTELTLLSKFLIEESDVELQFSHVKSSFRRPTVQREQPPRQYAPPRETPAPRHDYKYSRNYNNKVRTQSLTHKPPEKSYNITEVKSVEVCLCCGGVHRISVCKKMQGMSIGERLQWAQGNQVCFKCLERRHSREQCQAKGCGVTGCRYVHHKLLHSNETTSRTPGYQAPPPPRPCPSRTEPSTEACGTTDSEQTTATTVVNATSDEEQSTAVLLKVIPITVEGPLKRVNTYALLDDGSSISLAEQSLMEEVGITGPQIPLNVNGVLDMKSGNQFSRRVKAKVRGRNLPAYEVTFKTIEYLGLRKQTIRDDVMNCKHIVDFKKDACYDGTVRPRLLIGSDHWYLTIPEEVRVGEKDEPALVRCRLGWVVYGTTPAHFMRLLAEEEEYSALHCHEEEVELHDLVKSHFEMDSLGIKNLNKSNPAEQRAVEIFNQTCKKIESNRYEVGQLWRKDDTTMPPSYTNAIRRLHSTERKMKRDQDYSEAYKAQIKNLVDKGYAEKVNERRTESDLTFYLPHFGVTNVNKPGKLRLVFDAAAKVKGQSLNDHILEGPDLLQSLPGILYRFREGQYAVVADIAEMFLQVRIRKEDQPSQLFLWRENNKSVPEVYKMNSMIFGAASSPFLAHCVRNKNALDNAKEFPLAVEEITTNHYMDDFVASFKNESALVSSSLQVAECHERGGFQLRGWCSNSELLRKQIPAELQTETPAKLGNKESKILGLFWNPQTDELGFNTKLLRVPQEVKDQLRAPTKREMLSAVMSIYDPLGLLAHYTISPKCVLQKIWSKKIEWDQPLPPEDVEAFNAWLRAMDSVTALRIPRCYFAVDTKSTKQLHIFMDASTQAYACVAYWRYEVESDYVITLIGGRSKVSPTKQLSVPRLELQAALIGSRLKETILKHHRFDVEKVCMWTDSSTVLHWVRNGAKRYSMYVANRLGEIAELTRTHQWRWVPTKVNPADVASRPDMKRQVHAHSLWYEGPDFLRQPESEWPQERPVEGDTRPVEPEGLEELHHLKKAEHLLFQYSQKQAFPDELLRLSRGEPIPPSSRLYGLDPVLEEDGLLRMRGRINAAPVQGLNKRPIILDGKIKCAE